MEFQDAQVTSFSKFTETFSQIPLPKQAVIVNLRLAIVYRLLQAAAVGAAFWQLWAQNSTLYVPSRMDLTYWRGKGAAGLDDVKHCTDLKAYEYNYGGGWLYKPASCKTFPAGEDFQKTANGMFFMTFTQDTITETEYTEERCEALRSVCRTETFTPLPVNPTAEQTCMCSSLYETFVKNPEMRRMVWQHAYSVSDSHDGKSFQEGNSVLDYYTSGKRLGEQLPGKLLTRVMKPNGEPCNVSGQWQFLSGVDLEIGGSIKEWLSCGGYDLDDQSERTRSNDKGENMAPHLRTTGVVITLELRYQNHHPEVKGDVVTVCDAYVQVTPTWNAMQSTESAQFDKMDARQGSRSRFRWSQGVSFRFQKGGSFSYFDFRVLLTTIVSAVVLFGVPITIVNLVALYGIGLISRIYRNVLRQNFDATGEVPGFFARMMLHNAGFRDLTNQQSVVAEELAPMPTAIIDRKLRECFKADLEAGAKANLDHGEVENMAKVVLAGFHSEFHNSSNSVAGSPAGFVQACSSNEAFNPETFLHFMDEGRNRHCLERLLDPTRQQMNTARKRLGEVTGHISSMRRPRSRSGGLGEPVGNVQSKATDMEAKGVCDRE